MSDEVEAYIAGAERWSEEMAAVRDLLLGCGLDEAIKWRTPCFTHGGANVVILQPMRDHLALMFFKGALLTDPDGVLEEQGPNSRSARRVRVRSVDDVTRLAATLDALVAEAVAVEEAGLEVADAPELTLVEELQERLDEDPELRAAFESLTPGRRREYHLHVAGAKRSDTRRRRVEQHVPRILAGKGLRDR